MRLGYALFLAFFSLAAQAQEFPARDFRSICNFAPGSGADIIVRYYSDKLSKLTGRAVVVDPLNADDHTLLRAAKGCTQNAIVLLDDQGHQVYP